MSTVTVTEPATEPSYAAQLVADLHRHRPDLIGAGCRCPTCEPELNDSPELELLDNKPFRQLVEHTLEAEGIFFSELAERAGLDPERLRRALGLKEHRRLDGGVSTQTRITYSMACRLVRACGAWPVDYGV